MCLSYVSALYDHVILHANFYLVPFYSSRRWGWRWRIDNFIFYCFLDFNNLDALQAFAYASALRLERSCLGFICSERQVIVVCLLFDPWVS